MLLALLTPAFAAVDFSIVEMQMRPTHEDYVSIIEKDNAVAKIKSSYGRTRSVLQIIFVADSAGQHWTGTQGEPFCR